MTEEFCVVGLLIYSVVEQANIRHFARGFADALTSVISSEGVAVAEKSFA
jgi:hypothetical protein